MTDSASFARTGLSRRRFVQFGAIGVGAIAVSPYLAKLRAFAAPPVASNQGILVTIQLAGGNDGLNTVIPYTDPQYAVLRPTLAVPSAQVLPIGSGLGLHPSLPKLKARFDSGQVAIVNGVHYQPPDLSHFTSTDIYQEGWGGSGNASTGWLGRWLDTLPNTDKESLYAIALSGSVNRDLVGNAAKPSSLPLTLNNDFAVDRSVASDARMFDALANFNKTSSGLGALADFYDATAADLVQITQKIKPAYGFTPFNTHISNELTLAAHLINANLGIRVIDTTVDGSFDTHVTQNNSQPSSLKYLDDALDRFFAALDPMWANRVTVMTYSEFGRRPQENGDKGTDHGTAYPLFVVGANVKGGLYGPQPSLTALDANGNLVPNYDFRQVYASVLRTWLGADDTHVLGKTYAPISFFTSGPGVTNGTTTTTKASTSTSSTIKATTTTVAGTTTTLAKTTTTTVPKTTTTVPNTTTTLPPPPPKPRVAKPGYWVAGPRGGLAAFGSAAHYPSVPRLSAPIVGGAALASHQGLWLCGRDGGIFSFGRARFHGSTGNRKLNKPIVGMAALPSGKGYWLVASDGGIFTFGDAKYHGSTGNKHLGAPIVAMANTPSGKGYWLVASDGGIFTFGDAKYHGSAANMTLGRPVVTITTTPTGNGYWLIARDGTVFPFGDAHYHGTTRVSSPVTGMARTAKGDGYWIATVDGAVAHFGAAPKLGRKSGHAAVLLSSCL